MNPLHTIFYLAVLPITLPAFIALCILAELLGEVDYDVPEWVTQPPPPPVEDVVEALPTPEPARTQGAPA